MDERVLAINKQSLSEGQTVVYWMTRDQRLQDNHALLAAQKLALEHKLPLVVAFNVLPSSGNRSQEHFRFMLAGLKELKTSLASKNIDLLLGYGTAKEFAEKRLTKLQPLAVYFDFNPLRGPRSVQKSIAKEASFPCFVVDTHNIIPTWVLSDKQEYAAHTIRSKVHSHLESWLVEPEQVKQHQHQNKVNLESLAFDEVEAKLNKIKSSGIEIEFKAGEKAASQALTDFTAERLASYAENRNMPTIDGQSELSPYLHYGQLSALRVALKLLEQSQQAPLLFKRAKLASFEGQPTKQDSIDALLEELIVRKELADNYCFYNPNYDNLKGAPSWALKTLDEHARDERQYLYSLEDWQEARTHDQAWNAAQKQMMQTGKMHGYMRMYWAKKILEWSESPAEAIKIANFLNDHYSIDGGDPNGYTGIMWSIAGVHDRPWNERPVFGKIRYMNYGGLERRFKVKDYIATWGG